MITSVEKSPGWLLGLGILVLIFASLAISFPAATALIVTIFVDSL